MHVNINSLDDVNNFGKKSKSDKNETNQSCPKEIEVLSKPNNDIFNLKNNNLDNANKIKEKKKKKFCSIL